MTTQPADLIPAHRVAVPAELLRRGDQQRAAAAFLAAHGLSWADVKVWAGANGYMPADLPRPINIHVVSAYARAHGLEVTW